MTVNANLSFLLCLNMFCSVQIMASMFYITVSTFLAGTLSAMYSTFLFAVTEDMDHAMQAKLTLLHCSLVFIVL